MRILFIALVLAPFPAVASSPAAWDALDAKVARACLAKSGLRGARVTARLGFSDAVPVELRLLSGQSRSRSRGQPRTRVCAYSRTTGAVEVQDAPALPRRP